MKIKKEYLGKTIYQGRVKIHLTEFIDERTMQRLKNEYPDVLEPKQKKKKTENPNSDAKS
tara:strand:+ start:88 stop:267 length:180 start_codon:yes stop_codon:yes gene_type:complete